MLRFPRTHFTSCALRRLFLILPPELSLQLFPSISSVLAWSVALLMLWHIGVDLCSQGLNTIDTIVTVHLRMLLSVIEQPDLLRQAKCNICLALGGRHSWIISRHGAKVKFVYCHFVDTLAGTLSTHKPDKAFCDLASATGSECCQRMQIRKERVVLGPEPASPARPNYEVVGPNYRGQFGSEPFVLTVLDRITVKTELTRTELSR
jgi:hypothetical protein